MRKLARIAASAVPVLAFVALLLLFVAALKFTGIRVVDFEKNREALSGVQSLLTSLAILVGGLLSYFRFFAHRIWVKRAEFDLDVAVLPAVDGKRHAVGVKISNTGPLATHVVAIAIEGTDYHANDHITEFIDRQPFLRPETDGSRWMIDSGECDQAMFLRVTADDVLSSAYRASLQDNSGNIWYGYRAVRNVISDGGTE